MNAELIYNIVDVSDYWRYDNFKLVKGTNNEIGR